MKKWVKKEKRDEKSFSGRRQRGSGNQWHAPGDVKSAKHLIDSKFSDQDEYRITIETWKKICDEAKFTMRIPVLSVEVDGIEIVVMNRDDVPEADYLIKEPKDYGFKNPTGKSFSINWEKWDPLYEESLFAEKLPLLSLNIKKTQLAVLDRTDLLSLIDED